MTVHDVRPSSSRPARFLRASLLALASAAGAIALRGLLDFAAPDMAPYALVFPAALLATLLGGFVAGAVAGGLGLLASDYLFVSPRFTFDPVNLSHGLSLSFTALAVLSVVWITERYRVVVQARARERENVMKDRVQLFEKSHGFMFVLKGPEFRFEYANPAYLRVVGANSEDIIGKKFSEVAKDIEPAYLDLLAKVRQTGEVFVGRNMARKVQNGGVVRTYYVDLVCQPMRSDDGSVGAVFIDGYDVTEKVEAEQRLRFLVREVDHRANNLLAVVQSIINLTRADSVEALRRSVLGRIGALANAHQLLSDSRWQGADIGALVEEELQPYALGDTARARLQGPHMPLSPAEAEALAMAIHELTTNAAKFGALSTPTGRVDVAWTRDSLGGRHIRWQEDGGPPVVKPEHKGFGARVLERTLRAVPGGRTQMTWRPEGLVCEFDLPPEGQGEARGSIDEEMAKAGPGRQITELANIEKG